MIVRPGRLMCAGVKGTEHVIPVPVYTSPTTTVVWDNARPTIPLVGATVVDPNTNNRILRVTESGSFGEAATTSFAPFYAGWQRAWNSNSTKMMFFGGGGFVCWKEFIPSTMSLGVGGATLPAAVSTGTPTFDDEDPDLIWYVRGDRYLTTYNISTSTSSDIMDMKAIPGFDPLLNIFLVEVHGGIACVGTKTTGQDTGWQVLALSLANMDYRVIDFKLNTINGVAFDNAVPVTSTLHQIMLSRDGEVVMCDLHNSWGELPWNCFVNLSTGHVERSTTTHFESGNTHAGFGWGGAYINSSSNFAPGGMGDDQDSRGWSYRSAGYNNQDASWKELYGDPPDGPNWFSTSVHLSWMNNADGVNVNKFPIIGVSTRGSATRYWLDDEIFAVEVNAAQFGARVWRFARHYNEERAANCEDLNTRSAQVSPNGKWALFYSSWYGDTGTGLCTNARRTDIFVFELK